MVLGVMLDPFLANSHDHATIDAVGGDPAATLPLIEQFTLSECFVLAQRIRHITGWPIVALEDRSGDHFLPVHYLNRRKDGRLVDAQGVWPKQSEHLFAAIRHRVQTAISRGR